MALIMDFLTSFGISFAFIFIMELGDKTQLIIIALSTRNYSTIQLAIGAVSGFLIIVFLGGFISTIITNFISINLIIIISGLIFLIIGVYQLIMMIRARTKSAINNGLADMEKEEEPTLNKKIQKLNTNRHSFIVGLLAILSMELGDKTQLATIVFASTAPSMIGALIGAWLALSTLALIGAFFGNWISRKIPKKLMDIISTVLFIVIGLFMIFFDVNPLM
ncbi:MAG: TMEM165/GDT1 family protein [Promethearchaeota archaeon]